VKRAWPSPRPRRPDERGDDARVELRAGAAHELGDRVIVRHGRAVRAVRGHRVVGVAGEDDAAAERDLLAGEPVGVAGAVEALVLVADDARHAAHAGDGAQDALADDRVLAHDVPLLAGQRARLVQDPVGHPDLADVVQQRGVADALDLDLVEPEGARDGLGHLDDEGGVLARVAVALDQGGGQRLDDVRLGAEGVDAALGGPGRGAGAAVGAGAIQATGGGGQQALDRGARRGAWRRRRRR
jgi:hypothetical protein